MKIINESQEIHRNFMTTYRLKISWINLQIKNYFKTRLRISDKISTFQENSDVFPIRREINEICDNNFLEISAKTERNSKKLTISSASSSKKKNIEDLQYNRIPFIVNTNEKTLEDLNKNSKIIEKNPYQALLENQKEFKTLTKVMFRCKSKYKAYNNSDPLDTCVKFNFTQFLKKKIQNFTTKTQENQENGFLSDRNHYFQNNMEINNNRRIMKKIRLRLESRENNSTRKGELFGSFFKKC